MPCSAACVASHADVRPVRRRPRPLQVPLAQKWLIQKARLAGRPVMVAGQLMEGLATAPRPSRPEITDVVNAVRARRARAHCF